MRLVGVNLLNLEKNGDSIPMNGIWMKIEIINLKSFVNIIT